MGLTTKDNILDPGPLAGGNMQEAVSHSRTMCLEGSECRKVFSTFKLKVVGQTVYPFCVDNEFIVCYNRQLVSIVKYSY